MSSKITYASILSPHNYTSRNHYCQEYKMMVYKNIYWGIFCHDKIRNKIYAYQLGVC